MIKINLYCIGGLKEPYLKEAETEYLKRLSKYCKLNLVESSDAKITSFDNETLIKKTLDEEASKMLKLIKQNDYVVLIDLHGKELDSVELANKFKEVVDRGNSTIDLVIGGTLGLGDELRKRANAKICLSKLTFPHQLTRIIVYEQLFRVFKINNNESYHH